MCPLPIQTKGCQRARYHNDSLVRLQRDTGVEEARGSRRGPGRQNPVLPLPTTKTFPSTAGENWILGRLQCGHSKQRNSGTANGGKKLSPGAGGLLWMVPFPLSLGKWDLLGWLEAEECHVVCITHQVIDHLPSPKLGANRPNWCSHWNILCLSLWSQNLRPSYVCNQDSMLKRWWSLV